MADAIIPFHTMRKRFHQVPFVMVDARRIPFHTFEIVLLLTHISHARYNNEVAVDKRVFKNVKLFMENKKDGDDLFDRLNTSVLKSSYSDVIHTHRVSKIPFS